MWQPKKIQFKNLISHSDSQYIFDNGKAIMIYGINEDDDSQESNGSGKSALNEAIAIAITGSPIRKVTMEDLIKNGEGECTIHMSLYNTRTKKKLDIIRNIYASRKSAKLSISIDGKLQDDIPTVNEGNKYILELLDISREDLLNYYIISKGKYISFFNASDTDKKELINRFSNGNLIDGVDDIIEDDLEGIVDELSGLDSVETELKAKIDVYNQQLDELSGSKDEAQNNRILSLKKRIDELNHKRDNAFNEFEKWNEMSFEFDDSELDSLNDVEDNLQSELKELRSDRRDAQDFIDELERYLKGEIECPNCHHKFSLDGDVDIDQAKKMLPDAKEELLSVESLIKEVNDKINKIDEKREKIKEQKRDSESISGHIEKLNDDIARYKDSIDEINDEIEAIKSSNTFEDQIKKIQANINDSEKKYKKVKKDHEKVLKEYTAKNEWIFNFKRFKGYLANKSISNMSGYCNNYLSKIHSNLQVSIEGYKMLKSGKLSEKITASVLRNGLMEGDYDKFSAGERTRMDLCLILGNQKLINLNSRSGGLNLLILDEIIESVDRKGVVKIMKALNKLDQTIMVVTHASFDANYPYKMVIKKQDNCSKIVSE